MARCRPAQSEVLEGNYTLKQLRADLVDWGIAGTFVFVLKEVRRHMPGAASVRCLCASAWVAHSSDLRVLLRARPV